MSQIVTRKGPKGEDKEKRQTDSPVKEMKKKIAANAEKEKQAAEKNAEKSVQSDKKAEKSTEKVAEKPSERKEKSEKGLDKSIDKKDKAEKSAEKNESTSDKKDTTIDKTTDKKEKLSDKTTEKKEKSSDKTTDKKEKQSDKKDAATEKATDSKEKNGKMELSEEKAKKPETKAKENGAATNGEQNGDTVSSEDELQESDVERDEMFPELAYEDSDGETFEPPTPEGLPSRSYTRRSQVKAARTPETPRPASDRNGDRDYVPDDSKLLKLKDDALSTDRKLRSADSPKPQDKKIEKVQEGKKSESPKKDSLKAVQEEPSKPDEKDKNATDVEIEVVVEIENEDERAEGGADERRVKADTNFSKSRVKVSPYRRAREPADVSLLANYTGNNTTMEMDITESSLDAPESPYLSGLRTIRARRSYRVLQEVSLRSACRPSRNELAGSGAPPAEQPSRPTGTVVGRKRRPEAEAEAARGKRPRLLERLARPFRAAPPPARRAAEIVGINTDLPLSAPVASADAFDPEAIKPQPAGAPLPADAPLPSPASDRDGKRCIVM
ncbi:late embryogenesis abundant protein At3g53040-like isoform X1 [Vanessa atalanta]|uniref:late embryogenesis abundant protein At3g53040-like isoform X1 n=1 Tax=Vanessa atalanta TaxID=42275 RepID=UPI001FCD0DFD|nr:late embryogenesis abundant protein At3g53040-like isoform X1 [Vanessa atalanta]